MKFIPKEIRQKNEIIFSLLSQEGREDYSVWDNTKKTFLREGKITGTDGNEYDVKQTQFIARQRFNELFPNMGKMVRFNYEVLIDGQEYIFPVPKTVATQIDQIVQTAITMGGSYKDLKLKLVREGTGLQTRYTVTVYNDNAPPQQSTQPLSVNLQQTQGEEKTPVNSLITGQASGNKVASSPIQLSEHEQRVVDAIKQSMKDNGIQPQDLKYDQIKDILLEQNIPENRGLDIFQYIIST